MLRRLFISLLILSALTSEGLTNLPAYIYSCLNSENIIKQPLITQEPAIDLSQKPNRPLQRHHYEILNFIPSRQSNAYELVYKSSGCFIRHRNLKYDQSAIVSLEGFRLSSKDYSANNSKIIFQIEQLDNLSVSGLSPPMI